MRARGAIWEQRPATCLKTDITTIVSPTDVLENLRGTHFRWKADGKSAYDVIAQEVQQILPE